MKNFIFKSTDADLQKMFQSIETIQKNVLYLTYRMDMLIKRYDKLEVDKALQSTAEGYYDKIDADWKTSHQTDSDEQ